ncbi:hypothetical protein C8Q77DRAFT_148957 [Trametes polyzona]|nr:hypothetical protein C8Q77DRAFT_148957 [Trametes polyzona]
MISLQARLGYNRVGKSWMNATMHPGIETLSYPYYKPGTRMQYRASILVLTNPESSLSPTGTTCEIQTRDAQYISTGCQRTQLYQVRADSSSLFPIPLPQPHNIGDGVDTCTFPQPPLQWARPRRVVTVVSCTRPPNHPYWSGEYGLLAASTPSASCAKRSGSGIVALDCNDATDEQDACLCFSSGRNDEACPRGKNPGSSGREAKERSRVVGVQHERNTPLPFSERSPIYPTRSSSSFCEKIQVRPPLRVIPRRL